MKKTAIRVILALCGSTLILTLSMCCSMNRLQGYEFREHTVSALSAHPRPPEIFTDDWTNVDFSNPVEAIIGIGTGIAKEVEVAKTRAKLDSAMGMVDIPEIIRMETLERGAQYLHYLSTEDTENSDYLFDIIIRHYGIDAKSWSASVYFKMDAKITLLDNRKGTEVWRRCFNERFPVSREVFGLPDVAGNVITAVSLSQLTVEQIAIGLENLAVHTSDRMIHKLQRDLAKKNQNL
jgi:hypothetical protein